MKLKLSVNTVYIYITINELLTALENQDIYYMYILKLIDKKECVTECYEINNPIAFFNIDHEILGYNFCNNNFDLQMTTQVFTININQEFLNDLKRVF